MDFKGAELVRADRGTVFAYITDPRNFSSGIPDIQKVEVLDQDRFRVVAKLGVSVIRASFDIVFTISDRVQPSHVRLKGHGLGGGSAVDLEIAIDLSEEGAQTLLSWKSDAKVSGTLASLGQRVLSTVADRLVNEVFSSVRSSLETNKNTG